MASGIYADAAEVLQSMGLSENESKAYLALLRNAPMNGNEIAKHSRVPAPKIYMTLDKLTQKGLVVGIDTSPITYVARRPEELLEIYRSKTEAIQAKLQQMLPLFATQESHDYVWNLEGYDRVLGKAEELVKSAKTHLLVAMWDEQAEALNPLLHGAVARGVNTVTLKFGTGTPDVGLVYHHGTSHDVLDTESQQQLVLISDSGTALIGHAHDWGWTGIWSSTPGLVSLARNYLHHEIYLWKIHAKLESRLFELFGADLHKLRDITTPVDES